MTRERNAAERPCLGGAHGGGDASANTPSETGRTGMARGDCSRPPQGLIGQACCKEREDADTTLRWWSERFEGQEFRSTQNSKALTPYGASRTEQFNAIQGDASLSRFALSRQLLFVCCSRSLHRCHQTRQTDDLQSVEPFKQRVSEATEVWLCIERGFTSTPYFPAHHKGNLRCHLRPISGENKCVSDLNRKRCQASGSCWYP